ncbi:MAG: NAD(P)H-hydrate dehydratase [Saprospiraceae bacterium]|nr:NAD(P)H-hydrate dehydratase [Saprospiraceae bacterium]
MKIFTTDQIRAWDAYTIAHEPISSIDLMNRAASAFTHWLTTRYPDVRRPVWIWAGTGNNGGDGLAVARLLHQQFYAVKVFVCAFSGKHSADFDAQMMALPPHAAIEVTVLRDAAGTFPEPPPDALLIDALFGSGLSRPLDGPWARLIDVLNQLPNEKVAIDLPSGLFAERASSGPCLQCQRTFSFETPKLAFFYPENADRVGDWSYGSIGLHPQYAAETATPFYFLEGPAAAALVRPRQRFAHKGTFGHALLINGSQGKMGAAVLAAKACLRAGVGLLTVQAPRCGYVILQTAVPEAMCLLDEAEQYWSDLPDLQAYTAIGAGCGIGTRPETAQALKRLLLQARVPLVLDADALNLLAQHPGWFAYLPENSILTPHPKEFERLFGSSANSAARLEVLRAKAREHRIFIVLKGANTAIAGPDGACWFNSSGNPGMATGGSGDVLTGVLCGLLAQGYSPREACLLGVYLHGLAGDLAATATGQAGLIAGDLVAGLGKAWLAIAAMQRT